jgi:mono/diheme cytochrome c family protein
MRAIIVAVTIATIAAPLAARAAGDAETGAQTARRWCTDCHVAPGTRAGSDRVPALQTIARQRDGDFLRGFLARPHAPMPSLSLTSREIEDLIAYIESLR